MNDEETYVPEFDLGEEEPEAEELDTQSALDPDDIAKRVAEYLAGRQAEETESDAEPEPVPADERLARFVKDPDAYIQALTEERVQRALEAQEAQFGEIVKGNIASRIAGEYGLSDTETGELSSLLATMRSRDAATLTDAGKRLIADAARGAAIRKREATGMPAGRKSIAINLPPGVQESELAQVAVLAGVDPKDKKAMEALAREVRASKESRR